MLAAPAESPLQTLLSLSQLPNLNLERTWQGVKRFKCEYTRQEGKKPESIYYQTYIHERFFQALPNQHLLIFLPARVVDEGTHPLICNHFNYLLLSSGLLKFNFKCLPFLILVRLGYFIYRDYLSPD